MSKTFEVTYVSTGMNKTTQKVVVTAEDQHDARRMVEAKGNKVISVVYQGTNY